jgi:hypothetical protein
MSSSSASTISGLCSSTTRTITMNVERTYRWTRMLYSRVQFSSTAVLLPALFLADCIINIAEFEFSIGTTVGCCGLSSDDGSLSDVCPRRDHCLDDDRCHAPRDRL